MRLGTSAQRAGLTASPSWRASAFGRAGSRLTTWTGAKPRVISAQTMARAAPPAPSTTAAPGVASQPGAVSSRLARKPAGSVLAPTSLPSSSQSVFSAPVASAAGSRRVTAANAASLWGTVTLPPTKPEPAKPAKNAATFSGSTGWST